MSKRGRRRRTPTRNGRSAHLILVPCLVELTPRRDVRERLEGLRACVNARKGKHIVYLPDGGQCEIDGFLLDYLFGSESAGEQQT